MWSVAGDNPEVPEATGVKDLWPLSAEPPPPTLASRATDEVMASAWRAHKGSGLAMPMNALSAILDTPP